MEIYSVTVNGLTYEVQVEKKANSGISAPAPRAAAVSAPIPAEKKMTAPAALQGEKITAGAAGKVWKIVTAEGQSVAAGEPILILEAMKMEIPVVAPKDGVLGRIVVSEGSPVEAGDLLATIH